MNIFDFENYKNYVQKWISLQDRKGRGSYQKMAQALCVHPTLVSHVFRGRKELSLEQAILLCKFLQLSSLETDYFLLLVQKAKSGSLELGRVLDRQIADLRKKANDLVNRVVFDRTLNEEDKSVFYSSWHYSAIRLLTSIPGFQTRTAIQEYLDLPAPVVLEVLEFLAQKDLCRFDGNSYRLGAAVSHLHAKSKFISQNHINWRLKAIERHQSLAEEDLMFTGPLTISQKDALRIRKWIVELIQELGKITRDSPPEQLRCLNVDWVGIPSRRRV